MICTKSLFPIALQSNRTTGRQLRLIVAAFSSLLLLAGCVSDYLLPIGSAKPAHKPAGEGNPSSAPGNNKRGNKSPYTVFGKSYTVMPESLGYLEIGIASWYGKKFHGRLTSNGEIYDMYGLTAAHKALPLPTYVKVTNLDNRLHTILKVNDRGPFHEDRVIDLSYQAALELGFADKGTAPVVVEALDSMNYPNLAKQKTQALPHKSSYYLQIGAFSNRSSAETLMSRIEGLVASADQATIEVRILESEQQESVLHKVWLGPLESESQRDELALMVESAELGRPLRVEIE
jgi:rare lipoprotein A